MDKDEHIAQLRARRHRVEAIETTLESIRDVESSLQEMKEILSKQLKVERAERLADIREADKAGVPKTRISKEVGLSRANLYNHLKGTPADE
ncbi:hypothetical protein CFN78_24145 [Amycolatopsis antarctica]|uniref:Uncharacterized protein n=2 Tax=Pseudonocardiaceae TaxID=2070 RepID=H5X5Y8_9PSEU|nr:MULTISPECIES: hypothetical protein [Pseudonocardiaceae]EHR52342.1 hypothetical protein SacmaDRAFT_4149 [Saccharomonospora marina XMU15]OZM70757.1 hypothetical protein CFN78_24145 [Amycolatopsis antarctica]